MLKYSICFAKKKYNIFVNRYRWMGPTLKQSFRRPFTCLDLLQKAFGRGYRPCIAGVRVNQGARPLQIPKIDG